MLKPSKYLLISDEIGDHSGSGAYHFLYSLRGTRSLLLSKAETVAIQAGNIKAIAGNEENLQVMLEQEMLVATGQNEYDALLLQMYAEASDSETLYLLWESAGNDGAVAPFDMNAFEAWLLHTTAAKKYATLAFKCSTTDKNLAGLEQLCTCITWLQEFCSIHALALMVKAETSYPYFLQHRAHQLWELLTDIQVNIDDTAMQQLLDPGNHTAAMRDAMVALTANNTRANCLLRCQTDDASLDLPARFAAALAPMNLPHRFSFNFTSPLQPGNAVTEAYLLAELDMNDHLRGLGFGVSDLPLKPPAIKIYSIGEARWHFVPGYYFFGTGENIAAAEDLAAAFYNAGVALDTDMAAACKDCLVFPLCGGCPSAAWSDSQPPCPSFRYNIQDRYQMYLEHKMNEYAK